MPLPADRMPPDARTYGARLARLERTLTELRAARRAAVNGSWQELTVAGGWTATGSTWTWPQLRLQANGEVQVMGSLTPGTLTAGTTIATLPIDCLPPADLEFRVGGGSATASADLYVLASGAITIQNISGTITRISLTTVRFPTI